MARTTARTVELEIDVFTFDIDFAGHVSNITFIRWLEIGRLRLLEEVGLPAHSLPGRDFVPIVVRTEIDYRRPVRLGDAVHVSMSLAELRAASATLAFRLTVGDELAATARQRGLFVSADTGRPRRLSPDIRKLLEPYLATSTTARAGPGR